MYWTLHFTSQTGLCNLNKVLPFLFGELNLVAYSVQLFHCNFTCLIVPVCYSDGMYPLVYELRGLFQKSPCKYNNSCRSISYLIVLRL